VRVSVPTYITIIGFAAGVLTTLSFLPQLIHTWRLRRADDLSGLWIAAFTTGVILWLTYGLMLPSPPIIMNNAATLALLLPILVLKLYHRDRK
jgi:MtN3 and saliva related transmembrane protein